MTERAANFVIASELEPVTTRVPLPQTRIEA